MWPVILRKRISTPEMSKFPMLLQSENHERNGAQVKQ